MFYELSESLINFAKGSSQHPHYMNEIEIIRSKIHDIRGPKVMLAFELAEMYGVETRVLNQAVKRNIASRGIETGSGGGAEFDLYEDEGDNYNYLDGKYSNIKLSWNYKKHTLTIGNRGGS